MTCERNKLAELADTAPPVQVEAAMNIRRINIVFVVTAAAALLAASASPAAEWGSIKGRFVVDGAPPELRPLVVDKDAFCMQTKPTN